RDLLLRQHAPEAIGAHDEDVPVAQRGPFAEVDHRVDETAQATEDLVAIRMLCHLPRADDALVDEILNLRMVFGLSDDAALAVEIKTRIADVCPVGVGSLHDAGYASRPRRLEHRELIRVRSERSMRAEHRVLQEFEWIPQYRLRLLLE